MKVLLCQPGASYATEDVYRGLLAAMRRAGLEVITYQLDGRIEHAGAWLRLAWRRKRQLDPGAPKPTPADVQYQASVGMIERALRHMPDWIIIVSAMYFHPDVIVMLKRAGFKLGIVFTESPYDDARQVRLAPWADVVWTHERGSLERFRQAQPHSYYLRHAIDPERHRPGPAPAGTPAHDVVFVGTGFGERCEALAAVDWEGVDLGLYGTWSLLGSRSKLRRYVRGGVMDNAVAVDLYRAAAIGLNLHRTSMGFGRDAPRTMRGQSVNPRALELAACGVFTISDYRPEVDELFGDLVPTFSDPEELGEIARAWLADVDGRRRIARHLPDAVRAETFDARVEQMLADIARSVSRPALAGT